MRWRRAALVAIGPLAVACVALAGASVLFCEGSLRVPRRAVNDYPMVAGSTWTTESIYAYDKNRLDAWFAKPVKGEGRCVMVLHGIADSRAGSAGFAAMFLKAGYAVLLPDSRAHGTSEGSLVTYGLVERLDAIEWVRWLKRQGCAEIYGLGESLGASVLIQASAVKPAFQAIVAECPYADLRSVAEYRVGRQIPLPAFAAGLFSRALIAGGLVYARMRYGIDLSAVNLISGMHGNNTPILLIHGLKDYETPYWHSQTLAKAGTHASLWLVPDAGHVRANAAEPQAFRTRVLQWFEAQSERTLRSGDRKFVHTATDSGVGVPGHSN